MVYIPYSRSIYRILIGGNDVSDRIEPILIQVSVTDKAGYTSDTAKVTLDDRGGQVVMPTKGDPFVVYLGTTGRGVVERFRGIVDTVESTGDRGGGMRLDINGKGMDTTSGIKDPHEKHADQKSLGDAASEFGKAGGLPGGIEVHSSLASIQRPYWSMDGESIIAWGRRTAAEVGATFKIVGDKGIMVPRSAGLSASGKQLVAIEAIRGQNLISWNLAPDMARPQYTTVRGRWYDPKQAKWLTKDVDVPNADSGSGTRRQRHHYSRADEGEAEHGAGSDGKDTERDKGGGKVDIDGNPMAVAEAPCIVSGTRPGIDGEYTIESVTDTLDRGRGYTTSLELVRPGGKAGQDSR